MEINPRSELDDDDDDQMHLIFELFWPVKERKIYN